MNLPQINRKVAGKAKFFAEREYETNGYEREWLSKGYYHGYIDGCKEKENIILAYVVGASIGLLLGLLFV